MKVAQDRTDNNQFVLEYRDMVGKDELVKATIEEWDNGEGFDIKLDGIHLELTHTEFEVLIALKSMFHLKEMR